MTENSLHSIYSGAAGRGVVKKKFNWRRLAFVLLLLAVAVDLMAVCSYFADKWFFVTVASDIMEGEHLAGRERLERFVKFAYEDLERPTYKELEPLRVKLYYRFNPFHPSARDVVLHGCDYRGGCGSSSRVVMALLSASGIKSRSLILRDANGRRVHAVVNAFVDGRWAVADPLYGIVFTRLDGQLATARELKANRELFLYNTGRNPSYPQDVFTYDNYALMNWNKIPVILPAIHWVLTRTIGEERTAGIARPEIWMYPLPAFAALFTVFALIAAGVIRLASRGSGRTDGRMKAPR